MEEINAYKEQLRQIEEALKAPLNDTQKNELFVLKNSILELLSLTNVETDQDASQSQSKSLDDEYALFMTELHNESTKEQNCDKNDSKQQRKFDLESLEGMKCRAPYKHNWGNIVYHNAMVCSIISEDLSNEEDIKVRVLFMNPTHQNMVPCPYYFEKDCKFSEKACYYSHGEVVMLSSLQEYTEPNFDNLTAGASVLAKENNLWHRARIKKIYDNKCVVRFESSQESVELTFDHLLPLGDGEEGTETEGSDEDVCEIDDVINMSLMVTPSSQAFGDWEKHTRGIGSKLMQKMGYIVGTGLGSRCDGRIDPVSAVILPSGKSLDYCMKLRENAGGDKDLFSVERKMKRLQKKHEAQSKRNYENEKKKVDMFNFINKTLSGPSGSSHSKSDHRREIKKETSRNLNVASLQTDESIRKVERDLYKIKESLTRHTDKTSAVHIQLKEKLICKEGELKMLQSQALNIKNEQNVRNDKKKLTIF